MLDIRAVAYVAPVSEVGFASVPLTVRIANLADETGLITGVFRVYNGSTGLLLHTSDIVPFRLAKGQTVDASALTDFDPPAPADATYFVCFDGNASNSLVPDGILFSLGAFYFDVKPVGMGPAPAAHHATHEEGGSDPIETANLGTSELDTDLVLTPDGAGGVRFVLPPAAADHATLANLDFASAGHTGFSANPHSQSDHYGIYYRNDHFTPTTGAYTFPWALTAIASGTTGSWSDTSNHPGITRISSSTSANSGAYSIFGNTSSLLIAGTERSDFILRPQTLAGTTIRAGFHDATSITDAVDGAYFEMAQVGGIDGTLVGKTSSNSTRSTTATSYVLVTNTWYRLRVQVNAAANLVTFTLYSEAGAVLWTDTLNTNIPTAAGRQCGNGLVATNSGTTAVALADIDFQDIQIDRTLTR